MLHKIVEFQLEAPRVQWFPRLFSMQLLIVPSFKLQGSVEFPGGHQNSKDRQTTGAIMRCRPARGSLAAKLYLFQILKW